MTSRMDPIARLRDKFLSGLPAREAEIEDLTARLLAEGPCRAKIEDLFLAVHKLSGVAGIYGLPTLGALAEQAEAELEKAREKRPGTKAVMGIVMAADLVTEEIRRASGSA